MNPRGMELLVRFEDRPLGRSKRSALLEAAQTAATAVIDAVMAGGDLPPSVVVRVAVCPVPVAAPPPPPEESGG